MKCHGRLSPIITENIGVNQRGNASPTLFRHFLSDLGDYLHTHCGLCITDDIIVHLLWADDLVLISDSHKGLQKLLNELHELCAKNLMIVNEVKTKVLIYGQKYAPDIYFNGQRIEAVQSYKYLGNIISTIASAKGDIFRENYSYLCNQAKKAIFGMKQKLKHIGKPPPEFCFIYLTMTMTMKICLLPQIFTVSAKQMQDINTSEKTSNSNLPLIISMVKGTWSRSLWAPISVIRKKKFHFEGAENRKKGA